MSTSGFLKDTNKAVDRQELEMTEDDKKNNEGLQKFLSAIPAESRSQFLAAISSDEFLKSFGVTENGPIRVKFEDKDEEERFNAFVEGQHETSKEEYERFKTRYAATNQFGKVKTPFQTFTSGFQVTLAPRLGNETIEKIVLQKDDRGDTPIARQKTREKVVKAIKPEITTCKISRIITDSDEGSYDVASNAISSQTILNGIKRYVVQYDMTSIIMIPKGVSSQSTPASINSTTVWMNGIDDYDKIEDSDYSIWQEFILRHGSEVEVESDAWFEGTLLLSMESTL